MTRFQRDKPDVVQYYSYRIETLIKRGERHSRNHLHPITWRLVVDRCHATLKHAHLTGDTRDLIASEASLATYVNTLETGIHDKKEAI